MHRVHRSQGNAKNLSVKQDRSLSVMIIESHRKCQRLRLKYVQKTLRAISVDEDVRWFFVTLTKVRKTESFPDGEKVKEAENRPEEEHFEENCICIPG